MISTVAPVKGVPGARQANYLITEVLAYVQGLDDDELADRALAALNEAVDEINTRRVWHKLIGGQRIDLLSGWSDYGLAREFREPIHAEFLDVNFAPQLQCHFLPYKTFQMQYEYPQKSLAGRPEAYTVWYDTHRLQLNTAPDTSYVGRHPYLHLTFHRSLPYLTGPTDSITTPGSFNTYLIWRARYAIALMLGERLRAERALGTSELLMRRLESDDDMHLSDWSRKRGGSWRRNLGYVFTG